MASTTDQKHALYVSILGKIQQRLAQMTEEELYDYAVITTMNWMGKKTLRELKHYNSYMDELLSQGEQEPDSDL